MELAATLGVRNMMPAIQYCRYLHELFTCASARSYDSTGVRDELRFGTGIAGIVSHEAEVGHRASTCLRLVRLLEACWMTVSCGSVGHSRPPVCFMMAAQLYVSTDHSICPIGSSHLAELAGPQ